MGYSPKSRTILITYWGTDMNKLVSGWLVALCLFIGAVLPVNAADLILTSPPRETKEAGEKLFGPLASHLSKLLNINVIYQHPGNWLNYQREMRDDKYDIVFDGPHFISWRMEHLKHDVLVKLPGELEFYLVADKNNNDLTSLEQLVGKKICGISPPNLSTLTVLDRFRNPVRQPVIKGIKGGMPGVYKAFKDGQCPTAILRTTFFKKKLKQEDRDKLKILFQSAPLPNQAISVSRRLTATHKNRMLQSLTLGDGTKPADAIVKRFGGKKAKSFVPANRDEYKGHNQLLEGVIFGW